MSKTPQLKLIKVICSVNYGLNFYATGPTEILLFSAVSVGFVPQTIV